MLQSKNMTSSISVCRLLKTVPQEKLYNYDEENVSHISVNDAWQMIQVVMMVMMVTM